MRASLPWTGRPGRRAEASASTARSISRAASTCAISAQYQVTSAPAIAGDLVIVGSSIGDNRAVDLERGIVRAFDARSGALRWSWDPIPWAGHTTPRTGGGNAWSTLSVDAERGLVFVPTGSPSPDHYGGVRKGDNRWANSVVALRAATGELVWGFQVVHHDLWDYDVASQPTLFAWKDGRPAIAITTKMGRVFVLDRLTGTPLIPVEERAVPASDIAGEDASPTQPFSGISVVPDRLTADDAWGATADDLKWCREKIAASRSEGIFTPPSLQGTVVFPGFVGGVNWGSSAYDPERRLLFMNTNHLAIRAAPHSARQAGRGICAAPAKRRGAGRARLAGGHTLRHASRAPARAQRPALQCPAVGHGDRGRSVRRRQALGRPAGHRGSRDGDGDAEPRRADRDGRRPRLHRRGHGRSSAGLRRGDRQGAVVVRAPRRRAGHAHDVQHCGKQYLVIAAGGHGKIGTKLGDYVLAFTLP